MDKMDNDEFDYSDFNITVNLTFDDLFVLPLVDNVERATFITAYTCVFLLCILGKSIFIFFF